MTKLELIKTVSKATGVDRETVSNVIDTYVDTIKTSLIEGEAVNFRKFGTFYLKHRAEKTARNIAKNTTMVIPAHNIAAFKPAKEFADSIVAADVKKK